MAVDFNKDTGEPGSPHELFNTGLTVVDPIRDQYAVTADGQRFLLLKTLTETTTTPITVTLNWTSLIDK